LDVVLAAVLGRNRHKKTGIRQEKTAYNINWEVKHGMD